jgi:hypothetical protein
MARLVEPSPEHGGADGASDEEFRKHFESELTDARKSAEGWRNGLAALIGLTTIASAVNGGAALSALGTPAAVAAGVLLFLGITAAAFGIMWSMRAAYGDPHLVTQENFVAGGGTEGFRVRLAAATARDLSRARYATIVALAFVVAAIGVVWYAPRAQPPFVEIETTGLKHLCGRLVASAEGLIALKDPAGAPITVATKAIQSIKTVGRC